jgi:hypothetical protein
MTGNATNTRTTSRPVFSKTTSLPYHNTTMAPNMTVSHNATRTRFNSTRITPPPIYSNRTRTWPFHNSTYTRNSTMFPNRTTTSTLSSTTTTSLSCASTGASFLLQVSASGGSGSNASTAEGLFNNWWLHMVGDGILFTKSQASASAFAIDKVSGNLCIAGSSLANGTNDNYTRAAVVESRATSGSAVWLPELWTTETFEPQYEPINCLGGGTSAGSNSTFVTPSGSSGGGNGGGSGTSSAAAARSRNDIGRRQNGTVPAGGGNASPSGGALSCSYQGFQYWLGCGLQLDMGEAGGSVSVNGQPCQSIELLVVPN